MSLLLHAALFAILLAKAGPPLAIQQRTQASTLTMAFAVEPEAVATTEPAAPTSPPPHEPEPAQAPAPDSPAPAPPVQPPPRVPAPASQPPRVQNTAAPRPVSRPASPPAALPAKQGPATSPTATPITTGEWQAQLATWLRTHKTYPDDARRRGEEGRAKVRFTLDRTGRVIAVELLESTGAEALDAAVERMLQGATLPPPPGPAQDRITLTVQIRFSLRE